ncbi:PAS-domain containing protein [Variovorax sp. VNK109]|jgi:signal transduction histidine kinase|uniref:PAS-domain containing protein n=1 Tax=Variovorax sp. VNK109 TaxID=3400919 RepID=UPI003C0040D4
MNDTTESLKASAAALDSLGIAVCAYDGNDCAVLWNGTFLSFFPEHDGFIRVGEPYVDNLHRFYRVRLNAQEMPQIAQYIEAALARHRVQNQPISFQHRGRWLRVATMHLADGTRMRFWTETASPVSTDEIMAASAAARRESPDFVEHLSDGMMVLGTDGRISWVNDRFVLVYGVMGKGLMTGRRFEDVYALAWSGAADEERHIHEAGRVTLMEALNFTGAPFQLPLPGGRWLRVAAQRASTGELYFASVDITEMERSRRALEEKSHQLETTFASIAQGIFMLGPDGRLTTYNDRLLELLDLPRELMETRPTLSEMTNHQLARGDFGDGQRLVQLHARGHVAAAGMTQIPEHYLRRTRLGRVLEVKTQALPSGGMVRTFTDVTDYVSARDEIERLNTGLEERVRLRTAELEAANKELEAFSYSIAHDLRQPLTSIDGFSTLLTGLTANIPEGDVAQKAAHYAGRIRSGIRQMSALTDGLLALAQLSRAKLEWREFDLAAEARLVAAQLGERDPRRVVNFEIEPNLWVHGEPVLLRQVVDNLLNNAWKFTARRSAARIVVGSQKLESGETAYFVRDDGAGFDMAYVDKLFGAFNRLHSPGEFAGTGIGLATVQRIIARHGGRVWATGKEGDGATFWFTLGDAPPPD